MVIVLCCALGLFIIATGAIAFELDDVILDAWKRRKALKRPNLVNQLQNNVRRIRKIEQDGQAALQAIRNLHETKKKLNAEFREKWDNEYRILLPPPEAPKGREALKVKAHYRHEIYAYANAKEDGVYVNTSSADLIPIGFYGENGSYWYAFNNLPGHQHKVMFIPVTNFEQASNKFFAFLPEVKKQGDEWTWETSKVKALASNLKDLVVEIKW